MGKRIPNYFCAIKTLISHIVAFDSRQAIGANNDLLWHLPDDFKWFVKHTKGKAVIMGRKTMESLPFPLKNRLNLVISRNNFEKEGFEIVSNFEVALEKAETFSPEEIFIIGGAQIYAQTLDKANRLYITRVHHQFENADVFYPDFSGLNFQKTYSEFHAKDENHKYDFEFEIYDKI